MSKRRSVEEEEDGFEGGSIYAGEAKQV